MSKELDVDERGRIRDPDDKRERTSSGVKKRKRSDKSERLQEIAAADDTPKRKRRRREDESIVIDGSAVKKKKKRVAKLDEPASSKQLARVGKRKERVEKAMQELILVEPGDEFDRQYRKMFESLQTIIDKFEHRMEDNPSGRDVYALSTLYSQMREVIADIRSTKDIESQMAELEGRAYGAFAKQVGQALVTILFTARRDIQAQVKDIDIQQQMILNLEGSIKDRSDEIMAGYHAMIENVRTILS